MSILAVNIYVAAIVVLLAINVVGAVVIASMVVPDACMVLSIWRCRAHKLMLLVCCFLQMMKCCSGPFSLPTSTL